MWSKLYSLRHPKVHFLLLLKITTLSVVTVYFQNLTWDLLRKVCSLVLKPGIMLKFYTELFITTHYVHPNLTRRHFGEGCNLPCKFVSFLTSVTLFPLKNFCKNTCCRSLNTISEQLKAIKYCGISFGWKRKSIPS